MLGDSDEKMVLIPSTTNEWSQIDEKNLMMMMDSNGTKDMEKSQGPQQQQLKCPRCESSNTKFCYYNNYSLSQPRHFCKACKRYWTRGGTLRNVPVGGGCRKNKRIKRPSTNSSTHDNNHIVTASSTPNISVTTPPSQHLNVRGGTNPLFYGLTSASSDLNNPFARLFSSRVSDSAAEDGQVYPLADTVLPGLDRCLGLGFSSSGALMGENYGHGFNSVKQIPDVNAMGNSTTSSSFFSSYPMFGSSSSSSSSTSTMASLIASSLQQQKIISNMSNNFQSLAPYEEMQISGNNNNNDNVESGNGMMLKEEKLEGGDGQNRLSNWNNLSSQIHEQIISSTDPSISWNGVWFDPPNMGSNSVPSLI